MSDNETPPSFLRATLWATVVVTGLALSVGGLMY